MKKLLQFFDRNEKWLAPFALLIGFIIDNLTVGQADSFYQNILLSFYFIFLLSVLFIWHKLQSQSEKTEKVIHIESLLFLGIQFIFGNLFSALTAFYINGAAWFSSWPLLAVLFGGMIATEYLKKHFSQFLVQITTLYFLLFTYLIVIVPLFVKKINPWVFMLSGIISLGFIFGYVLIYIKGIPGLVKGGKNKIKSSILSVFILMNIFYFFNIIPPIPLALEDSGVYKSVIKNQTGYEFSTFARTFSIRHLSQEYTVPSGAPVYFFSSVYAPIHFEQTIVHEWQKKNFKGDWVKTGAVAFPIYGGNKNGYRGYTVSERVTKGEWRVLVKTERGQVLGGESFIVK